MMANLFDEELYQKSVGRSVSQSVGNNNNNNNDNNNNNNNNNDNNNNNNNNNNVYFEDITITHYSRI